MVQAMRTFRIVIFAALASLAPAGSYGQTHITGADTTSTPIVLSSASTTYILDVDFVAPGTAFSITADDVVLDLNGHTVYYDWDQSGSCNGVSVSSVSSGVRVTGGTINQRAGGGDEGDAIAYAEVCEVLVDSMTIGTNGPNSSAITTSRAERGINVFDNTINCDSDSVTNRHALFAAIEIQGVDPFLIDSSSYITGNTINGTPQAGIRVSAVNAARTQTSTSDTLYIRNNNIYATSKVTNGFGIHLYNTVIAVIDSNIVDSSGGNGRGISIEMVDDLTENVPNGVIVRDNVVSVREKTNPEYIGSYLVIGYGIKIEDAGSIEMYGNDVTATGLDNAPSSGTDRARAAALSITMRGHNDDIHIYNNTFTAHHEGGEYVSSDIRESSAFAVHLTLMNSGLVFENNTLESNHILIYCDDYFGYQGVLDYYGEPFLFQDCTYVKTGEPPAGMTFTAVSFFNYRSDSFGSAILNPTTSGSFNLYDSSQVSDLYEWDFGKFWTATVSTAAGASVWAVDTNGVKRDSTTADGSGSASLMLPEWIQDSTPSLNQKNDYEVFAASGGDTVSQAATIASEVSITLDLSGTSPTFELTGATASGGVLSLSWTDDSATEWYVQAMINDTSSYSILATSNSVSFPVDTGTVDVKITSSSGPVAQGQASN